MHRGRAGDTRFAGLGRDIDVEPERVAQAAGLGRAAHSAELDGFQARPARGSAIVVAADIVERVNAFIGADGDVARRGRHRRHAGDVVRLDRLLEETKPGIGDRAHVLHRLLRAPALVGVG